MGDLGKCRSCGAAIRWVTMAKTGKKNPLDAEPSEKGNVFLAPDDTWVVLSGVDLDYERANGTPLYLSHFATCPNSQSHRKGK